MSDTEITVTQKDIQHFTVGETVIIKTSEYIKSIFYMPGIIKLVLLVIYLARSIVV